MGVTGLLQQLKEVQEKTTLSQYKGKTLAVDTFGWLHRGLISCAQELCTDVATRGYVTSVMKKVDMLRHFGVEPLMVFDGSPLPTKEGTHVERRNKREKAREAATNFLKRGDRKSAWKEFMKAAAVTPEMAKSVMLELDRKHVKYVVAPYEADPQMVYLEKIGVVDGILSEDSDLLVFGCNRLITKLNDYGECIEINRKDFHKVPKLSLEKLTDNQWRLVAILSGCDYTKGIPGVGLKTAFNIVTKLQSLDKIIMHFKAENKGIPEEFTDEALKADLAFRFQKVYDPKAQQVTSLTEIPSDIDVNILELCCGKTLGHEVHVGICTGKLHPFSHSDLLSREQNLSAGKSLSVSSKRPLEALSTNITQSFSQTKSIASYFTVDKGSQKKPLENRKSQTLEYSRKETTKLSPSSKKLKKFTASSETSVESKFFKSKSLPVPKLQPPEPMDASFLTGDSEVPEESSPLRNIRSSQNTHYLTDDDDDIPSTTKSSMMNSVVTASTTTSKIESDIEEGYENDIEESPVKLSKIGMSWREKFALNSAEPTSTRSPSATVKASHIKGAKPVIHLPHPDHSDTLLSSDASYPDTPDGAKGVPIGSSLVGSSQFNISESEDEVIQKMPFKETSASKLQRFAFTGA